MFLAVLCGILLVSLFRRDPMRRWQDCATVIGFVVYLIIAMELQDLLLRLNPRTCDSALSRIDAAMGFSTGAFAAAAGHVWWVMVILIVVYALLVPVMGLTWLIEQDPGMRLAVLIAGYCCFAGYALFPAVGPGYANSATLFVHAPRNAMPSMHMTWALLLAMNARSRWLQVALWVYAALMVGATLVMREHYLIDLIAAVPFAVSNAVGCSASLANRHIRLLKV